MVVPKLADTPPDMLAALLRAARVQAASSRIRLATAAATATGPSRPEGCQPVVCKEPGSRLAISANTS